MVRAQVVSLFETFNDIHIYICIKDFPERLVPRVEVGHQAKMATLAGRATRAFLVNRDQLANQVTWVFLVNWDKLANKVTWAITVNRAQLANQVIGAFPGFLRSTGLSFTVNRKRLENPLTLTFTVNRDQLENQLTLTFTVNRDQLAN